MERQPKEEQNHEMSVESETEPNAEQQNMQQGSEEANPSAPLATEAQIQHIDDLLEKQNILLEIYLRERERTEKMFLRMERKVQATQEALRQTGEMMLRHQFENIQVVDTEAGPSHELPEVSIIFDEELDDTNEQMEDGYEPDPPESFENPSGN